MNPIVVSDALVAFPGSVKHLIPVIPKDWERSVEAQSWLEWQKTWFFNGLKSFPKSKEGIDVNLAFRHLHCIQRSFEPKHEHKQVAVAYLASLWFVEPTK